AYIMNLIRNIHFDNGKARTADIDHIRHELDRSDNMQLHKKIDILKAFLDEVVLGLTCSEDIDVEYNEFENKKKQEEIEEFAKSENVDAKMLGDFISEYSFSGVLNPGDVRDSIKTPMPLLKKKSLVTRICDFIRLHVSKYSI
ncbi:MAG: restriction endonuclease subunit R, partial [Solobacterium sp.]|nr:restriction endonuclease subunit R [Solobacterium sp.]